MDSPKVPTETKRSAVYNRVTDIMDASIPRDIFFFGEITSSEMLAMLIKPPNETNIKEAVEMDEFKSFFKKRHIIFKVYRAYA